MKQLLKTMKIYNSNVKSIYSDQTGQDATEDVQTRDAPRILRERLMAAVTLGTGREQSLRGKGKTADAGLSAGT